jgi:hypothetical protein
VERKNYKRRVTSRAQTAWLAFNRRTNTLFPESDQFVALMGRYMTSNIIAPIFWSL